MKVISLWQPWASLVVEGKKHLETRSWATSYRGPIGIHAAQKQPPKLSLDINSIRSFISAGMINNLPEHRTFSGDYITHWRENLVLGSILGYANLTDCILITEEFSEFVKKMTPAEYAFGDFTPGRYAWAMDDPIKLPEPMPARGRQRIWEYDIPAVKGGTYND